MRHSIYILNKLPTKVLKGETPYEAWKERKPDLSYKRVFGCIAHVKIPKEHVRKLDDRSKRMVYLGKEPGSKAHRVFDPTTGCLNVSRDVVFELGKGWDWNVNTVTRRQENGSFVLFDKQEDAHLESPDFRV